MIDNVQPIIDYLCEHFHEFGYRPTSDDKYFCLLQIEFPHADILEQLKTFHSWTLDSKTPVTHMRMRFRNWLKNAQKFR